MKQRLLLFTICFFFYLHVFAQSQVTGTVTAANGDPIVASVQVKGTTQGLSTDVDGRFLLTDVATDAVLVITSVGYHSQEVNLNGRNSINIVLEVSDQALEDVIVVAYGTSTRGTFTGSASTVNQEDIKDAPYTSFESALIGKVPGMQITNSSGQAGSVSSIRIRGIGSMNASNEPLYVIDGVPVVSGSSGQLGDYIYTSNNIMNSINPSDIESITVLKDAAASSLYGSRAANGVVLINTKKGKLGKPTINFKSSVGFTPSWATDNHEAAGVQEQVNMLYMVFHDYNTAGGKSDDVANSDALRRLNNKFNQHGYYFETNGTGLYDNVNILGMTDGIENREGRYFDWDDALFRTGMYQTNDLSVSGGTDNTKYYSSLSYSKDESRIKVNAFDRITGRVNLSQKIGDFIDFTSNINIAKTDQEGFNDTRNTSSNYFMQTRNLLWPLYWPTDYLTGDPWMARYGSYAQNNIFYDKEWENTSQTFRVSAIETLNIQLLPELNFKTVFSYDESEIKDHIYYSSLHYSGSNTNGSVAEMSTNMKKIVSSNTLTYDKQFGLHGLNLLVGFEAEKNQTDYQRASGTDLPSSALHTVATAGETTANAYYWGSNMMSVLSRAEYNYDQKYLASASFRRDGSSRLGPDTRWGNFWSVAGSWRLSREAFLQDVDYLSDLRLRASYGVNGTLPSSNYGWRSMTSYTSKYMEQAGGGISTIADANLTWETNYTLNLGLEFGLLDQRIYGTVEYFNRDSRDLLQNVPISRVTGFGSTLKNVGEMNNRGIELELGGDIIRNEDFRWSASINGSFIKSKVTKLYRAEGEGPQDIVWYDPTGGDGRAQYIYREGEPVLAFYGYEWAGVDPENGKNVWFVNDPENPNGDFIFNGRGASYDFGQANDIILGSALPDVYGGFNTDLVYKNFSLAVNFNYKIGGYIYDGANRDVADDGYYWERIRSQDYYDNMWTASNTGGSLPKIDGNDLTDAIQYSSRQMFDATYLRLKNLTLAYNLPSHLINQIGVSNVRLYANGTNLLTFSKYKIGDPEVNQYGTRGWETPFGRTYTFGIEFSF
ncbi:SusC/RagA family TonB-linked outer membrane protein [Albibacterium indicum]|uniref:SusC/RagA family TonB-linked outer membrane protein n=1 Tax=Albibacterium indicum TaxID=2292082 RepID=UPI000E533A2F|nr:TonB-dependent receptor [Pedobacter indicus]